MARVVLLLATCLALAMADNIPTFSQKELHSMPPAVLARLIERYQNQGQSRSLEIVGGEEVDPPFKYPWQAALMYTSGGQFCGGSLVNESFVLTAAHCSTGMNPRSVKIQVHRHDLRTTVASENAVERGISEIIVNPNYRPLTFDRDYALWKLDEPITNVDLITLDLNGDYDFGGNMATVTGWGALRQGGATSNTLQEVDVPLMTNDDCLDDYPGDITDYMLCAGYPQGGKDSCQGDSGGPLFVTVGGRYIQVGVVSWGYGCAQPNSPGVYARVSAGADWILQTIAEYY